MEVWFIDSYTDHSMCEDVVRFSVMDWFLMFVSQNGKDILEHMQ